MSLLDLVNGTWALEADKVREIQAIYATHLRGEKVDIGALEAKLGRPIQTSPSEVVVESGVAIIEASGVIAPKANLFMQVSGGISVQVLGRQLAEAMADSGVRSIVLALDSPGGNVLGIPELAHAIYGYAKQKPIVCWSPGALASGGYWLGCAANAVLISGGVVQVGSVGVVVTRTFDPTQTQVEEHITAGKYKRIANAKEPLSTESRAVVQADVDYVYTLFVEEVARCRGVSVDAVLEHMADGRVFRGQQAINAGLVDGVSTLDALVSELANDPTKYAARRKARVSVSGGSPTESTRAGVAPGDETHATHQGNSMPDKTLTREVLQTEHAPLFAALQAEFRTEGAQAERDRITAVRATSVPGHEALVEAMAFDGKSTAGDAALAVNAAVRAQHTAAAQAHADDAPKPAKPSAAAPDDKGAKTKAQQVAEAQAHAKANGLDFIVSMKQLGYAR